MEVEESSENFFPETEFNSGKFFSGMGISGKRTPIGIFFEIYIKFWIFIKKSGLYDYIVQLNLYFFSKT